MKLAKALLLVPALTLVTSMSSASASSSGKRPDLRWAR